MASLKKTNLFAVLRIVIGLILLVSGLEKTVSPYQNFLYVIQAYHVFSSDLQVMAAKILPWLELVTGLFLILGLYTRVALRAAVILFGLFIAVVAQALLRKLPLEECGCFGNLISLPPHVVIMMDSSIFILLSFMIRHIEQTAAFSLDRMFEGSA